MLYMRGSPAEYDEWEAMGNPGWNYKKALYYFKKSENMTIEKLATDTKYHSRYGPISVAYPRYKNEIRSKYVEAGLEMGSHEIDYNADEQIGVAYAQFDLKGATRMSMSKAYLDPIRCRENLYIFKKTECIKVLFSHVGGRKKAIGVTCVTDGEEYNVFASKEVILTAGAIGTAKLLLLSGIGPREDLEKLGIPVWVDSPVGKNFADQPGTAVTYMANLEELDYDDKRLNHTALEYAKCKKGLLSAPLIGAIGLDNTTNPALVNLNVDNLPNVLYIGRYLLPPLVKKIDKPELSASINLLSPASRGTVTLKSCDYKDPPLIDPNYYGELCDLELVADALQTLIDYFSVEAFSKYSLKLDVPEQCHCSEKVTMEFAACFVKYRTVAGRNPSGTAKMGPDCDPTAVVDPELRVYGVDGLRVMDGSIIPRLPRASLMITQVMIAEKGADMVIKCYSH